MSKHISNGYGKRNGVVGCYKKAYSKLAHAEAILLKMDAKSKSTLYAYKCPRCEKYHLGRDKYV